MLNRNVLNLIHKWAEFWGTAGAGLLFVCREDQTAFLLLRSPGVNEPNTWGVSGGAIEPGEDPLTGAKRETVEELGSMPQSINLIDQIQYKNKDFVYTTFVYDVPIEEKRRWTPTIKLNWESSDARWFRLDAFPSRLHFGVRNIRNYIKDNTDKLNLPEEAFHEVRDEFDWLRADLARMKRTVPKTDSNIFDNIGTLLEAVPTKKDSEGKDLMWSERVEPMKRYLDLLDQELRNILKYALKQKNVELAASIRTALERIKQSDPKHNQNKEVATKPTSEQSAYVDYLYHGTSPADAYSVLKNKQFTKGSVYDRLSLTSDVTAAIKFGTAVLVFDGKRLQRRGAKKLRYLTNEQLLESSKARGTGAFDLEDAQHKPAISDIYRHEKEWSVPLPFTFTDQDLVKIVLVQQGSTESIERTKSLLETVTTCPIQAIHLPSFSRNSPPYEKEDEVISGDIKFILYNDVYGAAGEFQKVAQKIIDEKFRQYKIEYNGDEDAAKRRVKSTSLYQTVNYWYGIFNQIRDRRGQISALDARSFDSYLNDLRYSFDRQKTDSELAPLVPIMEKVLSAQEPLRNAFVQTYLSNDQDYWEKIYRYTDSSVSVYRPKLIQWGQQNQAKLEKLIRDNNIQSKYEPKRIGESLVRFLSELDTLPQFSTDILRRFPEAVLDSKFLTRFPADKLKDILKNNPELRSYNVQYIDRTARGGPIGDLVRDIWNTEHPTEPIEPEKPTPAPEAMEPEENKSAAE